MRLYLYLALFPFTFVSLVVYYRVLRKIFLSRKNANYTSFFYKMTWSLAIYDITYVIVFFIMEIPQDWPELEGFYECINGTIIPQLQWAHQWQCYLAQFYGITVISLSRMLNVCHLECKITKFLEKVPILCVIVVHAILPLIYALFVLSFQPPRYYGHNNYTGSFARLGEHYSIMFNSNVIIVNSTAGALISAVCYIRVFARMYNRPIRSTSQEMSVIITSFALFISLCAMCSYYIAYKYSLKYGNLDVFWELRRLNFIVSFAIALINPWCLLITNAEIRESVLGPIRRGRIAPASSTTTSSHPSTLVAVTPASKIRVVTTLV